MLSGFSAWPRRRLAREDVDEGCGLERLEESERRKGSAVAVQPA